MLNSLKIGSDGLMFGRGSQSLIIATEGLMEPEVSPFTRLLSFAIGGQRTGDFTGKEEAAPTLGDWYIIMRRRRR